LGLGLILRAATLVLPSVVTLVLGSLLLTAAGSLAPVLPPIVGPVVPSTGKYALARVGLVTAAAAAARDEASVAAACLGTDGGLGGFWAGRGGWRLGGMLAEIEFNDLTARVGVATAMVEVKGLVLETVTVTVFELTEMYV